MIIAVEHQGGITEVHAIPAESPLNLRSVDGKETVVIYALVFDKTLDAIDLSEGELLHNENGKKIAAEDHFYSLTVEDGEPSAWEGKQTRPKSINNFRVLTNIGACPRFQVESFETTPGAKITSAVRIDENSVFMAMSNATYYRVTRDGLTPLANIYGVPTPTKTAFLAANGEVWLGGGFGRVCNGTIGPPADLTCMRTTTRESIEFLSGPTAGPVNELFTLGSQGTVEHLANGSWSTITTFPPTDRGGVIWLEPDKALVTGGEMVPTIYLYRNGQLTDLELETAGDGITALSYNPSLGYLAGTTLGGVHFSEDLESWRQVPNPFGIGVSEMGTYQDGFVGMGTRGLIAIFRRNKEFCEIPAGAVSFGIALISLGRDILVFGNLVTADPPQGTVSLLRYYE